MPTIRLRNISKYFGTTHALNDVTFDVRDGEYICVLGSTGSGKTTLLRTISGIIKPNNGEVILDEANVNNIAAEDRNTVYVPQNLSRPVQAFSQTGQRLGPSAHELENVYALLRLDPGAARRLH